MNKKQIISQVEEQLRLGTISKTDLLNIVNDIDEKPQPTDLVSQNIKTTETSNQNKDESSKNLIHTFYGIGAIIAIVGVGILIAQNWDYLGLFGRILFTLGISLITYVTGLILRKPDQRMLSQVMFTISVALAPFGVYVFLNELNVTFTSSVQILTAITLCIIYGAALFISKKNILIVVTLGFATWAYYALIVKIFGFESDTDLVKWGSMLLGVSYLFIAYGYQSSVIPTDKDDEKEKAWVQNAIFGFGTLAILGAGIFIGGIFDLFFIFLVFGAFYGSVYFKSKTMLRLGALFLMAHIVKLTSKYFIDSIGWPVALIVVGFLIIGVGYLTVYLNKNFISNR